MFPKLINYPKCNQYLIGFILICIANQLNCKKSSTPSVDQNNLSIKTVFVNGSLNVRAEPLLKAAVVFSLKEGEQVNILKELDEFLIVNKISGKWTEIEFQNQSGWVFGGFLSRFPYPKNCSSLYDYVTKNFKPSSPPEIIEKGKLYGRDTEAYRQTTQFYWENQVSLIDKSMYEAGSTEIILMNASLYEGYFIGVNCQSEFKNDKFLPDTRIQSIKLKHPDWYHYLKIEKRKNGISISYLSAI